MSWNCPFCNRKYPDSGIGEPPEKDADEKTHCQVCAVDPNEVEALVQSLRETAEVAEDDDRYNSLYTSGIRGCANQLEGLVND